MTDVRSLGRASRYPPPQANFLDAATNFEEPPTYYPLAENEKDLEHPRYYMGRELLDGSHVQDVLVVGLQRNEDGSLKWPEQGSAPHQRILAISKTPCSDIGGGGGEFISDWIAGPIHRLKLREKTFPVTCQVAGSDDEIFSTRHQEAFHRELTNQGVKSNLIIIDGKGHAFDVGKPMEEDTKHTMMDVTRWIAENSTHGVEREDVKRGRDLLG